MEGPARWNALTAQSSKSCPRAPTSASWNAEVDNSRIQEAGLGGDISISPAAVHLASLEFNYLCIDQDNNSTETECDCDCDEDKQVRIEAQYHSLTNTKAEFFSGGFLCGSKRNAAAEAVDFAWLTTGHPFETNEEGKPGDYRQVAVSLNGSSADCGQYYVGPKASDFLKLAYYVYNYTQIGKKKQSGIPLVDEAIKFGYQTYYSGQVFDLIEDKFEGDWREYSGSCGGDQVGRAATFQLLDTEGNTSPTIGNTGVVNFIAKFNINKPVRVTISSYSSMRVAGQRKWNAQASVLSSFRLAGVVLSTQATDDEGNPEQCCTPGMASYALSAISGDDPNSGVTENAWRQATQNFFNIWGFNDFIVRQDDEINSFVRKSSRCPNTVIVDTPTKRSPYDFANSISLFDLITKYEDNDQVSRFTLFDLTGKRILSRSGSSRSFSLANNLSSSLPSGIYLANISMKNGETITKKIVHTR